jgi:hypothetical protein
MSFPLTRAVPPLDTHETDTLDFKEAVTEDSKGTVDRFELAKDIAAMANGSGGTILVGACGGSLLTAYKPLTSEKATKLGREYEEAARDLCRPAPTAHVEPLPHGAGVLLAVHVLPHPFPVAVRCTGDGSKKNWGWGGPAWVFFARVMSQTKEFSPEVLPMLTPDVRRHSIIIRSIPASETITLTLAVSGSRAGLIAKATVVSVDDETNAFVLTWKDGASVMTRSFPLDMVRTVYRGATSSAWYIDMLPYNDPS